MRSMGFRSEFLLGALDDEMLLGVLFDVAVVVLALTALAAFAIVGLERIKEFRHRAVDRFRLVFPYLLLLGGVLFINDLLRDIGPQISWIFGWRITSDIIALEGTLVADLQQYAHPWLTYYFSYIYIYGYIFLLVFPIVAYFVYTDDRPVKEAALAYTLNYGIGVVCYMVFVAFGPRNAGPEFGEALLYTHWPESQLLTSEVNANVNVFPSLHTSLAATVAILAYRWRDIYWSWLPLATLLAISVAISTMYLGIHWATDVVAGVVLALVSVGLAIWLTRPKRQDGPLGRAGHRLRRVVDIPVDYTIAQLQGLYAKRWGDSQ